MGQAERRGAPHATRPPMAALPDAIAGVDQGELLEAALASARIVIVLLDLEGRIGFTAGQGISALGLKPEDLIGHRLDELCPEATSLLDAFAAAPIEPGAVHTVRVGDTFWEGRTFPRVDDEGRPVGYVGLGIDVTDRVRVEHELRVTASELEGARRELQDLAYVVSHDLKEPLRMVSSYVGLLERRYEDVLDQDAREFIHYAVDGAQRMHALLEGLLAYSRVQTRGDPFTEVSLSKALRVAEGRLRHIIDEKSATIASPELPLVQGDAAQLAKLFEQLLKNALLYRSEDPPTIRLSVERGETHWVIAVEDNGIGLDPAASEDAFVLFRRLNNAPGTPGIGAGLALARRIAQRHGGLAWYRGPGEDGRGSVFCFSLPIEASFAPHDGRLGPPVHRT